ncbi:F-box containing protein [Tokyovirus A1]|uniref:F-box containing protein n=1 Tax=Tokyovirus A1 TaxID=1826170 RepID=UPI0007A98E65|nr:F-box containing protein [Tokyovirus A1]BAU80307.1 F-box containing protein [Tokyovirus A1]
MFSLFPEEISLAILEFVDIKGLVSFGETAKTWNAFVKRNSRFLHKKVNFFDRLPLRLSEKLELWGKRKGHYHIDPLGKLQGETRVSGNTYSFLNGEFHGPQTSSEFKCRLIVKNKRMFHKGVLHGTTTKTAMGTLMLVFGKYSSYVQTEEWSNGVLVSRELKGSRQNKDEIFVLCGSGVCPNTGKNVEKYADEEGTFLRCGCHGGGLSPVL